MRKHRLHSIFDLWRDGATLRRVVGAETLIAARMEPMLRQIGGFGVLDLTFARDGEIAVVPFVHVDGTMLADPEGPPLIWPESAADALDDTILDAIETEVTPWLLAHFLGRRSIEEIVRTFGGEADSTAFAQARAYGFAGASPYARVAVAGAPYAYAARFARDKRAIVTDAPAGANGVAILARSTRTLVADLGDAAANAAARRWFGLAAFGATRDALPYDLAIGPAGADLPPTAWRIELDSDAPDAIAIAEPVPADVLISFDLDDSARAGGFAIRAPDVRLRRPIGGVATATGGSGGEILIAIRDAAARSDDPDVDEADALAARLRAEGFTVDVRVAASVRDVERYDLVHAMTLTGIGDLGSTIARAFAAGKPIVATAHLDDLAAEGVWGAGMSTGIHRVSTDTEREEHLALFERRNVKAPGLEVGRQDPVPGYSEAVVGALKLCGALVVSGQAEERFVRGLGFDGYVAPVGPCLPEAVGPEPIGHLVGPDDFVLVHAPVEARSNLLLLARAAMDADLPMVVLGPVVETEVLAMLREIADERIAVIPHASPGEIEALYRRARVFADVGWVDYGAARRARAALSGAALLLANGHYVAELWRPGLWTADRASGRASRDGLLAAWAGFDSAEVRACAARVAVYCDPVATLTGVVGAYARAQTTLPDT